MDMRTKFQKHLLKRWLLLGLMIFTFNHAKASEKTRFDPQGHYYAIDEAATIAQPNLRVKAVELAAYTQMPDQIDTTTAFYWNVVPIFEACANLFTGGHAFRKFDDVQRYLHSLDGGSAQQRRECLEKLIKAELQKREISTWRLGFLLHAYGDAYAHSFTNYCRGPYLSPHLRTDKTEYSAPLCLQEVLYQAPLGHGLHGNCPDLVRPHFDRFCLYFTNLVQLLNQGDLSVKQNQQVSDYLKELKAALESDSTNDEAAVFCGVYNCVNHVNADCSNVPKLYQTFNRIDYVTNYHRVVPKQNDVEMLIRDIQSEAQSKHLKNQAIAEATRN